MINGFHQRLNQLEFNLTVHFFLLIFQWKKKWINEAELDQFQVPGNEMNCHIPFQQNDLTNTGKKNEKKLPQAKLLE